MNILINPRDEINNYFKPKEIVESINNQQIDDYNIAEQINHIEKSVKRNLIQMDSLYNIINNLHDKEDEILECKKEIAESNKYNEKVINKLLLIVDAIYDIYRYADKSENEGLLYSLQLTMKLVNKHLNEIGIFEIEAIGQEFDPNLHEAIDRIGNGSEDFEIVVEVIKKGFYINDKVLRYSKVIVKG